MGIFSVFRFRLFFLLFFHFFLLNSKILYTILTMSNNRLNLDGSLPQDRTRDSQRTLVSPPRAVSNDSLEGAVGGVVELEGDRVQRLVWADQGRQGSSSNMPTREVRYSMGSRLPAPNNLQAELNLASRARFSAGGTQLPFRDTRLNPLFEQTNQNHQGSVQFHPTQVDFTRFSEPVATATQHGSSNSLGIGISMNTNQTRMTALTRSEQNFLSNQNDNRPLMNSTIQQSSSVRAPWSAITPRLEHVPPSSVSQPIRDSGPSLSERRPVSDIQQGLNDSLREVVVSGDNMESNVPTSQTGRSQPGLPGNESQNSSSYVHISEIQNYIHSYVRQLLGNQLGRSVAEDPELNNLVHQMGEVGLTNPNISRISREQMEKSPEVTASSRLSPPLRLNQSMNPPAREVTDRGQESTPYAFREVLRNSWPSFHIPDEPAGLVGPALNRQQYDSNLRSNIPIHDMSNLPLSEREVAIPLRRGRQPHQTCSILEKWPKFAGDSHPVPVTDFLRQIDLLSRSYQISKDELRTHAHLLFKDDAYVWYTAYEPKFDSWDTLLYYLNMRYDNPNRDRFIKEDLRNRKQRPNELFSAFLTDIETLSQRLMRKLSEEEKFDIVAENMKMSYKRRLALEKITSLEHLAQLCYRFDALEGNLYHSRGIPKTPTVNEVYSEEADIFFVGEESDDLEVAAFQVRKGPQKDPNLRRSTDTNDRARPLCWNCRKSGHVWRECDQKKAIFCHICGHPETTAFRCPQQHEIRLAVDQQSKNE